MLKNFSCKTNRYFNQKQVFRSIALIGILLLSYQSFTGGLLGVILCIFFFHIRSRLLTISLSGMLLFNVTWRYLEHIPLTLLEFVLCSLLTIGLICAQKYDLNGKVVNTSSYSFKRNIISLFPILILPSLSFFGLCVSGLFLLFYLRASRTIILLSIITMIASVVLIVPPHSLIGIAFTIYLLIWYKEDGVRDFLETHSVVSLSERQSMKAICTPDTFWLPGCKPYHIRIKDEKEDYLHHPTKAIISCLGKYADTCHGENVGPGLVGILLSLRTPPDASHQAMSYFTEAQTNDKPQTFEQCIEHFSQTTTSNDILRHELVAAIIAYDICCVKSTKPKAKHLISTALLSLNINPSTQSNI